DHLDNVAARLIPARLYFVAHCFEEGGGENSVLQGISHEGRGHEQALKEAALFRKRTQLLVEAGSAQAGGDPAYQVAPAGYIAAAPGQAPARVLDQGAGDEVGAGM